jgi:predicted RNA binding protein YcfA (HicA-like mRNA interferase family)
VTRRDKDLTRILDGRFDRSIDFAMLVRVLRRLGFDERREGSHIIFSHPAAPRALTIQPVERLAKEYQVKQVRRVILESGLLEQDE